MHACWVLRAPNMLRAQLQIALDLFDQTSLVSVCVLWCVQVLSALCSRRWPYPLCQHPPQRVCDSPAAGSPAAAAAAFGPSRRCGGAGHLQRLHQVCGVLGDMGAQSSFPPAGWDCKQIYAPACRRNGQGSYNMVEAVKEDCRAGNSFASMHACAFLCLVCCSLCFAAAVRSHSMYPVLPSVPLFATALWT